MNNTYIYILLGHRSFPTAKMAIVEIPTDYVFADTYKKLAKEKACAQFGLDDKETSVLDYKFLGDDITFIKLNK